MARPRKRDFSVSLFPFLSILACVLGVLTLMITSVVLTQIDDESVDKAKQDVLDKKVEQIQEIENDIKLEKKWIEPIRKEVLEARKINILATQVKELQSKSGPTIKSDAEIRKEMEALQAKNQDIKKKIDSMKAELPKMVKDLEQRSNPFGYATVTVQRSSSALGEMVNPVFIECAKDGLVVYNDKGTVDFKIPTGSITKDPKIKKLVQQTVRSPQMRIWRSKAGTKMMASFSKRYPGFVELREQDGKIRKFNPNLLTLKCQQALAEIDKATKAGKKPPQGHYVIFLVRPDGIASWKTGRDFCWKLNCKNGKLPIASSGPINLKAFLN